MEKHMDAGMVVGDWERVLLDVAEDGNSIIVKQEGEPVAVLVPVQMYKHLRRAQETVHNEEGRREHARGKGNVRDETADSLYFLGTL